MTLLRLWLANRLLDLGLVRLGLWIVPPIERLRRLRLTE
jgi:hypothetical protein